MGKKVKITGDRCVLIDGIFAIPEPVYEKGEVIETDESFLDRFQNGGYQKFNMVVRPDGTLALDGYPPEEPEDVKEDEPDNSGKSDQQLAVERSERMKAHPVTRQAPIV